MAFRAVKFKDGNYTIVSTDGNGSGDVSREKLIYLISNKKAAVENLMTVGENLVVTGVPTFRCLGKEKDKWGRVVSYTLQFANHGGNESQTIKADIVRSYLADLKIEITNLQLAADNRIINRDDVEVAFKNKMAQDARAAEAEAAARAQRAAAEEAARKAEQERALKAKAAAEEERRRLAVEKEAQRAAEEAARKAEAAKKKAEDSELSGLKKEAHDALVKAQKVIALNKDGKATDEEMTEAIKTAQELAYNAGFDMNVSNEEVVQETEKKAHKVGAMTPKPLNPTTSEMDKHIIVSGLGSQQFLMQYVDNNIISANISNGYSSERDASSPENVDVRFLLSSTNIGDANKAADYASESMGYIKQAAIAIIKKHCKRNNLVKGKQIKIGNTILMYPELIISANIIDK